MIEALTEIFKQNPYLILFLGMLVAGEAFLLPAIYVALRGKLDMHFVFLIALVSTVLADLAWYAIGYSIPFSRLYKWHFFLKRSQIIIKLERILNQYGLMMIVLSKFVYGTRTIAQVLAGVHRLPFLKYLAANITGISLLLIILIFLGHLVTRSLDAFQAMFIGVQIGFVVFILAAIGVQIWIKKIITKKFRF